MFFLGTTHQKQNTLRLQLKKQRQREMFEILASKNVLLLWKKNTQKVNHLLQYEYQLISVDRQVIADLIVLRGRTADFITW